MQPNGTQPSQTCPNCGADAQHRTWQALKGVHGPVNVKTDEFFGSPVTALICKQCGYIQLFVSPQKFYKGKLLDKQ